MRSSLRRIRRIRVLAARRAVGPVSRSRVQKDYLEDHNVENRSEDGKFQRAGEGSAALANTVQLTALERYRGMSIPDRKKAWDSELTREEKDAMADAPNAIPKAVAGLLEERERPDTGDLRADVAARVEQYRDKLVPDRIDLLTPHVEQYVRDLESLGADPAKARELAMTVTDLFIAQDIETNGRTLGDHGIRHLLGDAKVAEQFLETMPGFEEDPARTRALFLTAAAFHDTGYLTEPSRAFLDDDHPRWSSQFYDERYKGLVSDVLGEADGKLVNGLVLSHAGTHIDWERAPEATAFRMADNLALFQGEKLPPLFETVQVNTLTLARLAKGEIDLNTAKGLMNGAIRTSTYLPEAVRAQLHKAVEEVSPILPKFTLGMLGAQLDTISWVEGEHPYPVVEFHREQYDTVADYVDMGQRQFKKLAETYGFEEKDFADDSVLELERKGRRLAEFRVTGRGLVEKLWKWLRARVRLRKDYLADHGVTNSPEDGRFTSASESGRYSHEQHLEELRQERAEQEQRRREHLERVRQHAEELQRQQVAEIERKGRERAEALEAITDVGDKIAGTLNDITPEYGEPLKEGDVPYSDGLAKEVKEKLTDRGMPPDAVDLLQRVVNTWVGAGGSTAIKEVAGELTQGVAKINPASPLTHPVAICADALLRIVSAAPDTEYPLYRGITLSEDDVKELIQPGKEIEDPIGAWSSREEVAQLFSQDTEFAARHGVPVVLRSEGHQAVHVSPLTEGIDPEKALLYTAGEHLAGGRFRVKAVTPIFVPPIKGEDVVDDKNFKPTSHSLKTGVRTLLVDVEQVKKLDYPKAQAAKAEKPKVKKLPDYVPAGLPWDRILPPSKLPKPKNVIRKGYLEDHGVTNDPETGKFTRVEDASVEGPSRDDAPEGHVSTDKLMDSVETALQAVSLRTDPYDRSNRESVKNALRSAASKYPSFKRMLEDSPPPTLSRNAEEKVREVEARIGTTLPPKVEECYGFDPETGEQRFYKLGEIMQIKIEESEAAALTGKVYTHNHPSGGSLSLSDVASAGRMNAAEIRAVGNEFTYRMRPQPGRSWLDVLGVVFAGGPQAPGSMQLGMSPKLIEMEKAVRRALQPEVDKKTLDPERASRLHYHALWTSAQKFYPEIIDYRAEPSAKRGTVAQKSESTPTKDVPAERWVYDPDRIDYEPLPVYRRRVRKDYLEDHGVTNSPEDGKFVAVGGSPETAASVPVLPRGAALRSLMELRAQRPISREKIDAVRQFQEHTETRIRTVFEKAGLKPPAMHFDYLSPEAQQGLADGLAHLAERYPQILSRLSAVTGMRPDDPVYAAEVSAVTHTKAMNGGPLTFEIKLNQTGLRGLAVTEGLSPKDAAKFAVVHEVGHVATAMSMFLTHMDGAWSTTDEFMEAKDNLKFLPPRTRTALTDLYYRERSFAEENDPRPSEYALESPNEFFSECFAAVETGTLEAPPDAKKMVSRALSDLQKQMRKADEADFVLKNVGKRTRKAEGSLDLVHVDTFGVTAEKAALANKVQLTALKDSEYLDEHNVEQDELGRFQRAGAGQAEARGLVGQLRTQGGYTYSKVTKRSPQHGNVVSPYRDRERVLLASEFDRAPLKAIREFLRDNRDLLSRRGHYVGGWRDEKTGKVYLDVTVVTNSRERAERLAKKHGQIAYFDLDTKTEVRVKRSHEAVFKQGDSELQIVWAEVYAPNIPDSDGDFMTEVEIRKMAHRFMGSAATKAVDVNHDNRTYGCTVVESFIAREDDRTFIPGSWVVGVHVPDPGLWRKVKSGELNGFSMQADVSVAEREIEIEIPESLGGETSEVDGHRHTFRVRFDANGNLVAGETDVVAGHLHTIKRGTVTEASSGHRHRFSFVDVLSALQPRG